MEHRKWFVSLIGAGLALGMPLQGFAQEAAGEEVPAVEAESAAPAEMPPQEVSDGGVEAVREAQEGDPAPAEAKFKSAQQVLKRIAKEKGWDEGWD